MKNVYDIRYEKNLTYILSEKAYADAKPLPGKIYEKTAIIIYLFYRDTVTEYYRYIDNIRPDIDLYIISSSQEVLESVRRYLSTCARTNVSYILKENRGRDVSALLVAGRDIIKNYQYICFMHDKKERSKEKKEDTDFWIENLWGNQLGSADYINRILELFENNSQMGLLAPPEPVGKYFDSWYGFGWGTSFEATKKLADMLELKTDLRKDRPPITLGTMMWFRRQALQKLIDFGWQYTDFEDGMLASGDYVSYGIERIFAYVAQDAGYDSGTVMTVAYAQKLMPLVQYTVNDILHAANPFFPISSAADLEKFQKNKESIIAFAKRNQDVYLYGAGTMGRFCASMLKMEHILPAGYIVSRCGRSGWVDTLPVTEVDRMVDLPGKAVIITLYDEEAQAEIENTLKGKGCSNYINLWKT